MKQAQNSAGPKNDIDDALGRTVPRESDHAMLREIDDRVKREKGN